MQTKLKLNFVENTIDIFNLLLNFEKTDAIMSLPNNKAAGIYGVPTEFYKANRKKSATLLHPHIKDAWENGSFPSVGLMELL